MLHKFATKLGYLAIKLIDTIEVWHLNLHVLDYYDNINKASVFYIHICGFKEISDMYI